MKAKKNQKDLCKSCTLEECDFKYEGYDLICSKGYVLTVEDKQRLLREACELRKLDEAKKKESE